MRHVTVKYKRGLQDLELLEESEIGRPIFERSGSDESRGVILMEDEVERFREWVAEHEDGFEIGAETPVRVKGGSLASERLIAAAIAQPGTSLLPDDEFAVVHFSAKDEAMALEATSPAGRRRYYIISDLGEGWFSSHRGTRFCDPMVEIIEFPSVEAAIKHLGAEVTDRSEVQPFIEEALKG